MRTLPALFALAATLVVACSGGDEPLEPGWTRLGNGLRVCVRPVEGATGVAVRTVFDIGSDHDPVGQSGLAHLAEHLFVTSAAGETKARTADDWATHDPGGSSFALTCVRSTACEMFVAPSRLDAELGEIAARMGDLRIEQSDLDRERPRVLKEVDASRDGPAAAVLLVSQRLHPPSNGGRVVGVRADVEKLSLADVRERCRLHYKPINARLILAGAVEPTTALALIEKQFGALPSGVRVPRAGEAGRPQPGVVELDSSTPIGAGAERKRSVHIAFPAPSPADPDFAAFLLFQRRTVVDTNLTVEFFPVWREPIDGVEASVYVWLMDESPVEHVLARLDATIVRCASRAPSAEEIGFLRDGWGEYVIAFEKKEPDPARPMAVALRAWEAQVRFDRERFRTALEALTPDDLKRFAAKWLAPAKRVVVVAWGPVTKAPETSMPDLDLISEVRVALLWDEATQTVHRKIGFREYRNDDELAKAITEGHQAWAQLGKPDAPVTIDGDGRVPWSDVIYVVNIIKRCGIDKIEFAMGAPPKDTRPK